MPFRLCVRCGALTEGSSYCSRHSKRTVNGKRYSGRKWERIRQRVLRRDGFACTQCQATIGLEIHHRIPLIEGGTDQLDNLQTLCGYCHRAVTYG
jgi:5-methylcytosine-specific restriction enzyme A